MADILLPMRPWYLLTLAPFSLLSIVLVLFMITWHIEYGFILDCQAFFVSRVFLVFTKVFASVLNYSWHKLDLTRYLLNRWTNSWVFGAISQKFYPHKTAMKGMLIRRNYQDSSGILEKKHMEKKHWIMKERETKQKVILDCIRPLAEPKPGQICSLQSLKSGFCHKLT